MRLSRRWKGLIFRVSLSRVLKMSSQLSYDGSVVKLDAVTIIMAACTFMTVLTAPEKLNGLGFIFIFYLRYITGRYAGVTHLLLVLYIFYIFCGLSQV